MSGAEFPWPFIDGARPRWTGSGFSAGGRQVPVLAYDCGSSGWSDGLTRLHEEAAGEDHPMDRLSRSWALSALRRHVDSTAPALLEIGSASGFFLRELRATFPEATVIGSDYVREPLERFAAGTTGIPLLQFDLVRCPLPDACVDAVVLLNVLEHIDRDDEAMKQAARILRPGGIVVVEVPAGPHLFDAYDEHLRHERRYTAGRLRSLLQTSGLAVVDQNHLGFMAYPAFALVKRWNRRRQRAGREAARRIVERSLHQTRDSALLRLALRLEEWLGRHVAFPVGIRTVAVGRKPPGAGT